MLRVSSRRVIASVTFDPGDKRSSRCANCPAANGSPLIAVISSSSDMPAIAAGDPRRIPATMVFPFSVLVATPR